MSEEKKIYKDVHNYTKYKLVEMLIKRLQDDRLNLDNLNAIEDVADDELGVISMCGLKFHQELRGEFDERK